MIRFFRLFFLMPLLISLFFVGDAALGAVVGDVSVRSLGSARMDQSFVLAHVATKTGDTFDRAKVSRDVRRLLDTKRFSYVAVDVEPAGRSEVEVVYVVQRRALLADEVKIVGNDLFREAKLQEWIGLEAGDYFDEQLLETAAHRIQQQYREERYPDARAEWTQRVRDKASLLTEVTFSIEEGDRLKVKRARFNGNTVMDHGTLRRAVGLKSWWRISRYFSPARFDAKELAQAERAIKALYLSRGYLSVKVSNGRVDEDKQGRAVAVFDIDEGPQYVVGDIVLENVKAFPLFSVQRVIKLKTGDIASAEAIQSSVRAVRDFYGARGYVGSYVAHHLEAVSDTRPTVDLVLKVEEGNLTYLRNVIIRGNTRTRDPVIRSEVLVYPGEIFNEVKVQRTKQRLMNMGYFETVKSYSNPTGLAGQQDLVLDVVEKSTGQFMVGVGYSSVDQITGFVEVSQGNFDLFNWPRFTGGGQKIKLRAQVSDTRKDYELSFVEPRFLGRRLTFDFDLFSREKDYDDYEVDRTGFGVGLAYPLRVETIPILSGRLGLRYELEKSDVRDDDVDEVWSLYDDPTERYDFADDEKERTTSSVELRWTRDRRNRPFRPDRGYRLTAFSRLAGGPFGADTDIYRVGLRAKAYVPLWFNHVLSVRGRADVVDTYGDMQDVPIDERLFLGGPRTIRGYEYNDIGPKAVPTEAVASPTTYRTVGGQSLAMCSVEYLVPLNDAVRLAAFYDRGNVWSDPYEFELNESASSFGVGVRLDMPGFPIRIDYAWGLEGDDELTREDAWAIWIGYD